MTQTFDLPKKLLIFGILTPIALLIGYLIADGEFESLGVVGLLGSVLVIPFLLRSHHFVLVLSLNLVVALFFLPGSPPPWMLACLISGGLIVLAKVMNRDMPLNNVPSVSWSLLAIGGVVVFTMAATGTLGLRSLGGSSYGGKKYFYILAGIVAYFCLSTLSIPRAKVGSYIWAMFLPGLSNAVSNLIYWLGQGFWVLFLLFPTDNVMLSASEDFSIDGFTSRMGRVQGLAFASTALISFLLARFGIRGMTNFNRPGRSLLLLTVLAGALVGGAFGGFRSVLVLNLGLIAIQFYLEGMHRTAVFPMAMGIGLVTFLAVMPVARKLPLSIQRTISFLPIDVSPAARLDALGSIDWRMRMWEVAWREVPNYLWVGKGYTASSTEYFLTLQASRYGMAEDYELSLIAGDYHSGLLSILLPFGIFGVLAFVAFLVAGARVLILNFRNGDGHLKIINTFLLGSFLVRTVFFFGAFGGIHIDLLVLASLVGFSISLNHGVRKSAQPA